MQGARLFKSAVSFPSSCPEIPGRRPSLGRGVTGSECGKGLVQAIEKRICNVCQHHDQFNEKFYDRVWLKCAQVTTFSTNGWTDRPFNSFYSTKSLRPLCEIED